MLHKLWGTFLIDNGTNPNGLITIKKAVPCKTLQAFCTDTNSADINTPYIAAAAEWRRNLTSDTSDTFGASNGRSTYVIIAA